MVLALVFAVVDALGGAYLLRHSRRPGLTRREPAMIVGLLLLLIACVLGWSAWKAGHQPVRIVDVPDGAPA